MVSCKEKRKQFLIARDIHRGKLRHLRAINCKKAFLLNKAPKAIPNGRFKIAREDKAELFRKVGKHKVKQVFRVMPVYEKYLSTHSFNGKPLNRCGLRFGSEPVSMDLLVSKTVNNRAKGLPFEHFCK